jgi:hypothetical protein
MRPEEEIVPGVLLPRRLENCRRHREMPKMVRHAIEAPSRYVSQPPLSGVDRQAGSITKSSDTISVIIDPLWHGWAWTCPEWQSLLQSIVVPTTRSPSASLAMTKWVKLASPGPTICRLDADQIEHSSWDMPVNPNPFARARARLLVIYVRQINFIDVFHMFS